MTEVECLSSGDSRAEKVSKDPYLTSPALVGGIWRPTPCLWICTLHTPQPTSQAYGAQTHLCPAKISWQLQLAPGDPPHWPHVETGDVQTAPLWWDRQPERKHRDWTWVRTHETWPTPVLRGSSGDLSLLHHLQGIQGHLRQTLLEVMERGVWVEGVGPLGCHATAPAPAPTRAPQLDTTEPLVAQRPLRS